MKRTNTILSPVGLGFTLILFIGLGFTLWTGGGSIFSPGKLTAKTQPGLELGGFDSHAAFESECRYCHAPLETTQGDLCLRCHSGVGKQFFEKSGTHGALSDIQECRNCHPDHRGRDFDPTFEAMKYFDHNLTNFNLIWHQIDYDATPLECAACHVGENNQFLPVACQDCHAGEDPDFMAQHLTDFGDDCLACHDGLDTLARFDHSATAFPLENAHVQIPCVDCHLNGQFEELASDCVACHAEPELHRGLFSQDCAACHTTVDWLSVSMDDSSFDHFTQTGFNLQLHMFDYHGQVLACTGCHAPGANGVDFNLNFCIDCHTIEAPIFMQDHQTQFGMACLDCHDGVDRMSDFDHARFFALDGAHSDLDCEECHVDQTFVSTPSACVDCHTEPDIHLGLFGLDCESCHTTTAWTPATLRSHTFLLDHGGEGMVACEVCHETNYVEYTCYGCHEHQPAETASKHREEGISQVELSDCASCHPTGREGEGEHDD